MSKALETLKDLISNSKLSPDDQQDLINLFSKISEKPLSYFLEILEEEPDWLVKLNANYKAKKAAIENRDREAWMNIVEEELASMEAV